MELEERMMECEADERGEDFHFWEVDGPNWVMCECGAEGRITVVVDDD